MELNITKEEFAELYRTTKNAELAAKLGISLFQLRNFAKLLGLEKKCGRPVAIYKFADET